MKLHVLGTFSQYMKKDICLFLDSVRKSFPNSRFWIDPEPLTASQIRRKVKEQERVTVQWALFGQGYDDFEIIKAIVKQTIDTFEWRSVARSRESVIVFLSKRILKISKEIPYKRRILSSSELLLLISGIRQETIESNG